MSKVPKFLTTALGRHPAALHLQSLPEGDSPFTFWLTTTVVAAIEAIQAHVEVLAARAVLSMGPRPLVRKVALA